MMRRIGLFILLGIVFLAPTRVYGDEENLIQVLCQIFRIRKAVQAKISADKDLWADDVPDELKKSIKIFSKGSFDFGADKLVFKNRKCYWNDKRLAMKGPEELKLSNSKISMIFAPEILLYEHSSGKVKIEATQPIQYFSKRRDGLFELKEMELSTGVDIDITKAVEDEKKDDIELSDFIMTIRSVEKRELIEGVNLAVGKPILEEHKYVLAPRLDPGEDYGILISPKNGRGAVLLRLQVNSIHSGTYKPKAESKK